MSLRPDVRCSVRPIPPSPCQEQFVETSALKLDEISFMDLIQLSPQIKKLLCGSSPKSWSNGRAMKSHGCTNK